MCNIHRKCAMEKDIQRSDVKDTNVYFLKEVLQYVYVHLIESIIVSLTYQSRLQFFLFHLHLPHQDNVFSYRNVFLYLCKVALHVVNLLS